MQRASIEHPKFQSCFSCPVGRAAGVGQGGRCVFVDRHRGRSEYVYIEGEAAEHVWFVKRGQVVLTQSAGDTNRDAGARAIRGPGAFLGLEALVRHTYLDTARALTDVTLCGAARADVDAWLGPSEAPARAALQQVLLTMCGDIPRGASADGSSVVRVARWILDDSPTAQNGGSVPRHVVANLLGMVPETLSRALAQLARSGAIQVTRQEVKIRNPQALRAAAGL